MRARIEVMKLTADLKDEEDRTDMFASDLVNDKQRLTDERDQLQVELDELRLTLGYERSQLARLEYRKVIREAAPPQREHPSTTDRRLSKANDRVVVLWEENKTMSCAIREFVETIKASPRSLTESALFDIHFNGTRKSTFCCYPHAIYYLPNSISGPHGEQATYPAWCAESYGPLFHRPSHIQQL